MKSPIPLAVIGLGNQGKEHLAGVLTDDSPFALVAICDEILALQQLDLPENCRAFDSVEALLRASDDLALEAVIVATPPATYRSLLPLLLEAGLHVLVEKPLGLNLREAAGHLAAASKHGKVLMPAVQRRFHATYRDVPLALRTMGTVEEALLQIEITHRPGGWRKDQGMGVLMDLGFHAIDLARELFGDLRLHSALLLDENGNRCYDQFDSAATLIFHTESGTTLRLEVKRSSATKMERFEAIGHGYELVVNRGELLLTQNGTVIQVRRSDASWNAAMNLQLRSFASACRNHQESDFSRQAGLITMKLLEETYAHATTH